MPLLIKEKAPTLHDLAAAVGLHMSTVSLALSGKGTISAATRQRVLATAREIGYQPNPLAQRLASSTSNTLVCILSSPLDLGLRTYKLVRIQNQLVERSLEVPIYTYAGPPKEPQDSPEEAHVVEIQQVRQICLQRPRAIVCAGAVIHPTAFPELESYQREGGIVVSYDIQTPLECDQVLFDREDNAYQATRCLLEHGHRKIGIAMSVPPSWSSDAQFQPWTSRLRGFQRALAEFGVPLRDEWLFLHATGYEEGGEDLARRFLSLADRPTGLCIVNDYVALAFMVQVMRAGVRIPEQVSIVGHDNQRIASLCPVPMTSATHPADEIADRIVAMLTERIRGYDGPPRTEILRGEFVTRKSVAAPPRAD